MKSILLLVFAAFFIVAASANIPAEPSRAIYGADDRLDWYEETHPERIALARSTCGMFIGGLADNGNGTWSLGGQVLTVYLEEFGVVPLCDSEPFYDQPASSWCSAFLVASDIVASASHCNRSSLAATRFVFNFYMYDANTPRLLVDDRDVYQAVEIVGEVLDNSTGEDWVLVRLDRPVTSPGAIPLPVRRTGAVAVGEPVAMIGHPCGWPSKIVWDDDVKVREHNRPTQFIANIDAYGGNSGSAIFNQSTGIVEGIAKGGDIDFVLNGECAVSFAVGDTEGAGTGCVKTTLESFHSLIPIASPAGPPIVNDVANGDGDGIVEAGESNFQIRFPIRNVGETNISGITATLTSEDPDITITNDSISYPEIPAGLIRSGVAPFTFEVSQSHNFQNPIPVTIEVTLPNDGGSRSYRYELDTSREIESETWVVN